MEVTAPILLLFSEPIGFSFECCFGVKGIIKNSENRLSKTIRQGTGKRVVKKSREQIGLRANLERGVLDKRNA